MQAVKKYKTQTFVVAMIASVLGAAAVPGIVLSAVHGVWWLMAICIALVANVFYGGAFYWMAYATAARMTRCVRAITVEGLNRMSDLASYLCCDVKTVSETVRKCMQRGYLNGYLLTQDGVSKIVREPEKPRGCRCPYCLGVYDSYTPFCPRCNGPTEPLTDDGEQQNP